MDMRRDLSAQSDESASTMSSSSASAISGLCYSINKTITTNVERTCRWTRMLHSHVQFNGSPCRPRGRQWRAIDMDHPRSIRRDRSASRRGSRISPEKRRQLNHPAAIWTHWRGAQPADCGRAACLHVVNNGGARPQRAGKAIHWLQEPIRRAASAMRESRSNDLLIVGRVALQAAIRSKDDLFALLKDTPTPPAFPPPVELALA